MAGPTALRKAVAVQLGHELAGDAGAHMERVHILGTDMRDLACPYQGDEGLFGERLCFVRMRCRFVLSTDGKVLLPSLCTVPCA